MNDRTNTAAIKAYASATGAAPAYVNRISPLNNATDVFPDTPLSATIVGLTGTNVNVSVNGTAVPSTVTTQGTNILVTAQPSALLASGSTNTYTFSFGGVTNSVRFVAANYSTLPSGLGFPLTSGDTNALGFRVKVVQARVDAGLETTVARAESQLAGTLVDTNTSLPYVNEALPGPGPGGTYVDPDVINWNQDAGTAEIGDFVAPTHPDEPIPGIPGSGGHNDNIAAEIFAYVPLKAGLNRMGVNSDDGFRLTISTNANTNAPIVGVFDARRGSADTLFSFVAPTAGLYPMRLVWFEGGGGANLEFFIVDDTGQRVLINDPANPASPKVFYKVTSGPGGGGGEGPAFSSVTLSGGNLVLNWTGNAVLQSADTINGTWTPVAGATAPYSAPATGPAKFYRLVTQ